MSFAFTDDFDESRPLTESESKTAWIVFGVLMGALALAYADMLQFTSTYWVKGLYSHGWIVPLIAAYLFSIRRKPLVETSLLDRWLGVAVVAASLAVRLYAAYYDYYKNLERLSFLAALLGVCLIVGGRKMVIWAGPALAFLIFMFPLPAYFENNSLMWLQGLATKASVFTLQLLGVGAARSGNVISIYGLKDLTVAEACSGLRMLTIFCSMSVALVMIIERPWWDKLIILVSAIPIAIVSNVVRIVTTALLLMVFGDSAEWLQKLIHDWAGFAMMPVGLGLLMLEMGILSRLTIPVDDGDFGAMGAAHA